MTDKPNHDNTQPPSSMSTAVEAALAVPEGWKLVPVEATVGMAIAGQSAHDGELPDGLPAGHILTRYDHACGDFKDEFDWSSLSPHYLRQINHPQAPKR